MSPPFCASANRAGSLTPCSGTTFAKQGCEAFPRITFVLRHWFRELELKATEVAFPSIRGTPLSSDGLDYILQQAVQCAAITCPSLLTKRVTPHRIRHSSAMHLLQAGVDMAVIALWLGHESIETTHIYVVLLDLHERALELSNRLPSHFTKELAENLWVPRPSRSGFLDEICGAW
jgi:site-specific recombinase XerD